MAHRFEYVLGIIGGGAAGLTAAAGASQLGAKTALIEREQALGGDCLHHGCVPSKTLIRTAEVAHLIRNARAFGLPEIALSDISFPEVALRIRDVVGKIQEHDSVERFTRLGVDVMHGQPEFMDSNTVELGSRRVSARHWLIATGSSPMVPDIPGLNAAPYLTNRELFSLEALPKSLAIIGGGPIAIEMAQAFQRLGSSVTVIEQAPQILPREDRDMAEALCAALGKEGVSFILNASVRSVSGRQGDMSIEMLSEGRAMSVKAEALLVATGRRANLEGLGLSRIGIEHDARGIATDARMRTNISHIYAAGDVTGRYQFTHAAGYEAGIVITNAIFRLPRKADHTHMPWCTYSSPELGGIGIGEREAMERGLRHEVITEPFSGNDRALAEGAAEGMIKLVLDHRERPLGVRVLGPAAGEALSEWVAAFASGMGLTALASSVHPYPTLSEINKRVAEKVVGRKIFSRRVRLALRVLYGLKGGNKT